MTIRYSVINWESFCCHIFNEFFFFREKSLLEVIYFLSLEMGGISLLCEWSFLLTSLTLSSVVIFRNVVYVKIIIDSTNSN